MSRNPSDSTPPSGPRLNRRAFLRLAAAAGGSLAAGSLLQACAPSAPPSAPAGQAPAPQQPPAPGAPAAPKPTFIPTAAPITSQKRGGSIKIGLYDDAATMDPHTTTSPPAQDVRNNIYDRLITWGDNFEFIPSLADSWTVSSDGKTHTFKLRPGVKFHNGADFTAEDVKYSIERIQKISPRKADYAMIKEVGVVDPLTVTMRTDRIDPTMLPALSMHFAHMVPREASEADIKANGTITKPIGTGPFEFVSWAPNREARLKRFEGYKPREEPANGQGGKRVAYLDELVFIGMADEQVRLLALQSGELDYIQQVPPKDVERVKKDQNLTIAVTPGTDWACLYFNFTKPPFNDLKMRQAVAHGLNYEELVKAVFWGYGQVNNSFMPMTQAVWRTAEHERLHKYDPALSKSLIKEAGYKGEELAWLTRKDYRSDKTAQVIQAQLKDVGFNVKLEASEPAAFLDSVYARRRNINPDWPFVATTSSSYRPDPSQHYQERVASVGHAGMYKNPTYDEIVAKASSITNFEERKALYSQAQKIVMDDVPVIILYNAPFIDGYRNRLQGVVVRDPFSPFFWNVSIK